MNLLSSERCSTQFTFEKLGVIDFIGVSRAAMGTAIAIPQLRLQLDAGMNVFNFHPDAVFITHCHADHCFRVTHFVSRSKPAKFIMPAPMTGLLENYLFSSQQLSAGVAFDKSGYEENHITVGVNVESEDTLTDFTKNKNIGVHIIKCHHRDIPCAGYAFFLKHKGLKAEYQGMDKKDIGQLAKSGEAVNEEKKIPLFIFLGDTTAAVFDSSHPNSALPLIEKEGWKVVFVECSFIYEDEIGNATRTGHMHWNELKPVVQSHPSVTFVLIHFSRRYSKAEIDTFFETQQDVHNIRLFVAPEDDGTHVHPVAAFSTLTQKEGVLQERGSGL